MVLLTGVVLLMEGVPLSEVTSFIGVIFSLTDFLGDRLGDFFGDGVCSVVLGIGFTCLTALHLPICNFSFLAGGGDSFTKLKKQQNQINELEKHSIIIIAYCKLGNETLH